MKYICKIIILIVLVLNSVNIFSQNITLTKVDRLEIKYPRISSDYKKLLVWDSIRQEVKIIDSESLSYKEKSDSILLSGYATQYDLSQILSSVNLPWINVKDFGALGDGSTDDINSIQSALNQGTQTIIFPKGTYVVSQSISIPSDRHLILFDGTIVKLKSLSDTLLVTNSDWDDGNHNITIEGGIWDGNGSNQTNKVGMGTDPNTWHGTLMRFQNVNGLRISNTIIKDPGWFGIHLGKVKDFTVENITFDYRLYGGDCLHISGLSNNGFVHNLKDPYGEHDDSFVAIMSTDAPQFDITPGEIHHIVVDGVFTEPSDSTENATTFRGAGIDFLDTGAGIHDISVSNVIGQGAYAGCQFMDASVFTTYYPSNIYNITFDKINVTVPDNSAMGVIVIRTNVKNLSISNLVSKPYGSTTIEIVDVTSGAVVDDLTFNNVTIIDSTDTGIRAGITVMDSSLIKNLTINNWTQRRVGDSAACTVLMIDNVGTVNNIKVDNATVENSGGNGVFTFWKDADVVNLSISNSSFKNCNNLVSLNVQNIGDSKLSYLNLSNITYSPWPGTTEVFKFLYNLSDTVRIKTSNVNLTTFTGTPIIKYSPADSVKVRLNSFDFPVNPATILSPVRNDMVLSNQPGGLQGALYFDGSQWRSMWEVNIDTLTRQVSIIPVYVPHDSTLAMAYHNFIFNLESSVNPHVGLRVGLGEGYVPYLQALSDSLNAKTLKIQPFGGQTIIGTPDTTVNSTLHLGGDFFAEGEANLGAIKSRSLPLYAGTPSYAIALGTDGKTLNKYNWPISSQWITYGSNIGFSGGVGVGTSNPQEDLEVNGNIEIADTMYSPSVITAPKSFSSDADFTMVFIGDMHHVIPTNNWSIATNSITRWIKSNKITNNIVAVMAGGDLSNDGTEWTQAMKGFDTLAASGIPYIASMGNHDYTDLPTRDRTSWDANLPVSRFSDETWYGGVYGASTGNMFIKFDVGTEKFLIISLEILPPDAVLTWADSVVTANSDRKVIVSTHYFLKYTGLRATSAYSNLGVAGNNPSQVWDEFIKGHENIIMVINGHDVGGIGSAKLTSVGDSGNIVNQVYNNYQETVTGDMVTEIMLLTFSPSTGKITTQAYAPLTNTVDTVGNYTLPYTTSIFDMDLKSTGNILSSGDITASGSLTVNNGIQSAGDISTSGSVIVDRTITADTGRITTAILTEISTYDVTIHDSLTVAGKTGLTGDVNAYADLTVSDDLTVEDTTRISKIKLPEFNSLELYTTTAPTLKLKSYGVVPSIRMFRINGSISSPTATLSGQALGSIQGCGHNGSAETLNRAQFGMVAAEDWTSTNNGAYAWIGTTGIGTTNQAERVRVTSDGNVGINTTLPSAMLHVQSQAIATPTLLIRNNKGTGNDSVLAFVGKSVGIGTTAPTVALEIVGQTYSSSTISSGAGLAAVTSIILNSNAARAIGNISTGANSAIMLYAKNAEVMRLAPTGNVGIGTTAPQNLLHTKGTIRAGGTIAYTTNDSVNAIRLAGNATVWEDLMFPFSRGSQGNNDKPSFDADSNWFRFLGGDPDSLDNIMYMTVQLPHKWKQGSIIYPHIHYNHNTVDGTPTFRVRYKWFNNGAVTGAWNYYTLSTTTGTTNDTHQMVGNSTGISGSGKTIGSILLVQVYLVTEGCNAYQLDFHHEIDSMGSNTETSKD